MYIPIYSNSIISKMLLDTIWLVVYLPLWEILVSWDDYSKLLGKKKMFQTTSQQSIHIHPTQNWTPACGDLKQSVQATNAGA